MESDKVFEDAMDAYSNLTLLRKKFYSSANFKNQTDMSGVEVSKLDGIDFFNILILKTRLWHEQIIKKLSQYYIP